MTEKHEPVNRQGYLKVALIMFGFWLFIISVIFNNIQELGGLSGLIEVIKAGDYSDFILVALSIFLLAKAVQSLFKYINFQDDTAGS